MREALLPPKPKELAPQDQSLPLATDDCVRYIEHRPEHFHVPPGKSENYTIVEISLFAGRSAPAKHALYQAIVQKFGQLGIAPGDVLVLLNEVPVDNWGIRGGVPAS